MITRRKAIIIIAGSKKEEVLPILKNHEALVQIAKPSEIQSVWSKNKTPIVDDKDVLKICRNYEGNIYVFDTDEQDISDVKQEEVSEEITKFCYDVKIEPGEYKVPNTASLDSADCIFCDIINHPGTTLEYNKSCKFVDMIIYETANFLVVPGLGPLAPGYLMIMPKEHYLSLAQVPDYLMFEYHEIEQDMEEILWQMYKLPVGFYEHGTGPNGIAGFKSIVHMHIHVMLNNELKEEYRNMLNMHEISDITQAKDISYFWYKWGSDGQQWIADDPKVYIQRQFHRQVYAEEHNLAKDQFNWRKTSFDDLTKTNVWQLYTFLKDVTDPRIKSRTRSFVEAAALRF